jgi:prepilin-type processing-associated H-X9-DG protein
MAADYLAVFHDYDTSGLPYNPRVSDYMCNPVIMPDTELWDDRAVVLGVATNGSGSTPGSGFIPLRQNGSIRRPTETMEVWCGPQNLTNGSSAQYIWNDGWVASQIDEGAVGWTSYGYGLYYPVPADSVNYNTAHYINPIAPGNPGGANWSSANGNVTKKALAYENQDDMNTAYSAVCAMRFRHMANTTGNMLFVDGHVESRVLGTVVAKDISVNSITPFAAGPGLGP